MIKVLNLEKALEEKKLKLQNLIEAKQAEHADKNVAETNPKLLAQVSTYLQGRMKTLSGNMADVDASMKKREDEINATLTEAGTKAEATEMKKSKAMLDMLVK